VIQGLIKSECHNKPPKCRECSDGGLLELTFLHRCGPATEHLCTAAVLTGTSKTIAKRPTAELTGHAQVRFGPGHCCQCSPQGVRAEAAGLALQKVAGPTCPAAQNCPVRHSSSDKDNTGACGRGNVCRLYCVHGQDYNHEPSSIMAFTMNGLSHLLCDPRTGTPDSKIFTAARSGHQLPRFLLR
jgi:hypothetical protein